MAGHIEVESWINERTVERAYGRAMEALQNHEDGFAEVGMRAAMARDARLLLALDKGAEVLAKIVERQVGRFQRTNASYGEKAELTELGLWRNAYEATDQGIGGVTYEGDKREGLYYKLYPYRWVIGCAAELAGLRP